MTETKVLIFDLDKTLTDDCFTEKKLKDTVIDILKYANKMSYHVYIVTARPVPTNTFYDVFEWGVSNEFIEIINKNIICQKKKETKERPTNKIENTISPSSEFGVIWSKNKEFLDSYDEPSKPTNIYDGYKFCLSPENWEIRKEYIQCVMDGMYELTKDSAYHTLKTIFLDHYSSCNKFMQIEYIMSKPENEGVNWKNIYFFDDSVDHLKILHLWVIYFKHEMKMINFIGGADMCVFAPYPREFFIAHGLLKNTF